MTGVSTRGGGRKGMETVYIDNYEKIFCEMRRNGMVTTMASRVQEIEFLSDRIKAT